MKICSTLCGEDKKNGVDGKGKKLKSLLSKDDKVEVSDTELNVDKIDEKVENFGELCGEIENEEEEWSVEDKDRLLLFTSKIFLLNFPLYVAFKHSVHWKLEVSLKSYSTLRHSTIGLTFITVSSFI